MSRIKSSRNALDYPHLPDDRFVIWSGNEHVWPDARRETFYLGTRRSVMKNFALMTIFAEEAETFESREAAETFLETHSVRRGHPYHDTQITTVAELKVLRGYEQAPEPVLNECDFQP